MKRHYTMQTYALITALLTCFLLLCLTACNGTTDPVTDPNGSTNNDLPPASENNPPDTQPDTPPEEQPPEENPSEDTTQPSTELSRIMDALLEGTNEEITVVTAPVERDRFSWYFGIEYLEDSVAYASEAAMSAIPHSVALLKVPAEADTAAIAEQIDQSVDPRKWICVEAETKLVKQYERYILVILSFEENAKIIADNFDAYFQA